MAPPSVTELPRGSSSSPATRSPHRRSRGHNFSGGPGALPLSVLEEAARAVELFEDTGDSILGLSHRSARFKEMVEATEAQLLELLNAPPGFHVLFLQGGGSLQFSMIPMHLLRGASAGAEYIATGYWSEKAIPDARLEGRVRVLWSGEQDGYRRVPDVDELTPSDDAAYLHYVSNETVEGVRFPYVPGCDGVPRVCDMSSDFLSAPIDLSRYDLVYAHAQKNLGPAGVTVVLVRDWILERGGGLPSMLRYRTHADHGSIFNTPPVFAIYVMSLVIGWIATEVGGLPSMKAVNEEKARRVYAALDARPDVFEPHAEVASRSFMNVSFRMRDRALEPVLVAAAERANLLGIGGHRSLGGIRISLYNAVTPESVDALCDFLAEFVHEHA
jgi:phosphoserine aminotransferase